MPYPELIIYFFLIALIYSSVGFGGGSSYLALLAFYALPFKEIRLIALLCNIIVVSGGTILFIRQKSVNWRKIIPVIAISIPLSYVGARLKISEQFFFILLGSTLLIASIFLWVDTARWKQNAFNEKEKNNWIQNGFLGGTIGFISGMVGIGGGIFLSPLLNILKWDKPKKIAAAATIFILANSLAGIGGQLSNWSGLPDIYQIGFLCLAVFLGGQIGSRIGIKWLPQLAVRRITAVLVFVAGVEVLIKHISI